MMTKKVQAVKTNNLKMGNSVNQHDAEQTVYDNQQEKLHKAWCLVDRIGPDISSEVQEFDHRILFMLEDCNGAKGRAYRDEYAQGAGWLDSRNEIEEMDCKSR
jgi:hypothetical protein